MTDGGEVVYKDDASIEAGDPIWRRISPGQWTYNHNKGQVQPMSGLFQYNKHPVTGQKHPMSITLGKGITPDAATLVNRPARNSLVGRRNTFARWRWEFAHTNWRVRLITVWFSRQETTRRENREPASPVLFKPSLPKLPLGSSRCRPTRWRRHASAQRPEIRTRLLREAATTQVISSRLEVAPPRRWWRVSSSATPCRSAAIRAERSASRSWSSSTA